MLQFGHDPPELLLCHVPGSRSQMHSAPPHLVCHAHVLLVCLRRDARPDGLQLRGRRRRHHVRQRRVAQVLRAPPQEPPQVLLADAACAIGLTSSAAHIVALQQKRLLLGRCTAAEHSCFGWAFSVIMEVES